MKTLANNRAITNLDLSKCKVYKHHTENHIIFFSHTCSFLSCSTPHTVIVDSYFLFICGTPVDRRGGTIDPNDASSIRTLTCQHIPDNVGSVLASNPHLTSLSCDLFRNEEDVVELARSTSLTSIDCAQYWFDSQSLSALMKIPSLTHMNACVETIDVFSHAFPSSSSQSAPQLPSSLTSLSLSVHSEPHALAHVVSTCIPHLRTLRLKNKVDLSAFQPMPFLQDLTCSTAACDFTTFASRMPSLTRLDVSTERHDISCGWDALASSCPHLTSRAFHKRFDDYSDSRDFDRDIQCLTPLPLTALCVDTIVWIEFPRDAAIDRMSSLQSLSFPHYNANFLPSDAHALSRLSALTKLELLPTYPERLNTYSVHPNRIVIMLQSLVMLEDMSEPH